MLVTGGSGFVGRRLVARLAEHGANVFVLARTAKLDTAAAAVVQADVLDESAVRRAFDAAAPAYVFHLAAHADWRQDPALTVSMCNLHVVGTAHVLEAARKSGVSRVVTFGSAGEYGSAASPMAESARATPLDPYSTTKLAATELALTYARSFGVPCTVLRPFVIYGVNEPSHRLLPSVFRAALAEQGLPCTLGEQVRDFVYVDDVVECALRAAVHEAAAGEILNVGTGVGVTVRELVEQACAISGGRARPRFGALPYRVGEPMDLRADINKLRRVLGWVPKTSTRVGIERAWAWWASRAR